MISKVSSLEWIDWTLLDVIALILFVIIYGLAKYRASQKLKDKYDRLGYTMELYLEIWGEITKFNSIPSPSDIELHTFIATLKKCKAAPHITSNLLGQIEMYSLRPEADRLLMVYQQLEIEMEHLRKRRITLLERIESPRLGSLLWQLIAPIIPFVFAVIIFFDFCVLTRLITYSLHTDMSYKIITDWIIWLCINLALLTAYPLCTAQLKKAHYILLSLGITIVGIIAWYFPIIAPYILGLQLILLIIGITTKDDKPRKKRPFAGHTAEPTSSSNKKSLGEHPDQDSV